MTPENIGATAGEASAGRGVRWPPAVVQRVTEDRSIAHPRLQGPALDDGSGHSPDEPEGAEHAHSTTRLCGVATLPLPLLPPTEDSRVILEAQAPSESLRRIKVAYESCHRRVERAPILEGHPWSALIWGAAVVAESGFSAADGAGVSRVGLGAVASALDAHDGGTRAHARRVCDYSLRLAREIGVPQASWKGLALGAILHDVGKIALPTDLLFKEGGLTDAEWEQVRQHPAVGYEILKRLGIPDVDSDIVLAHHERWDGAGYPRGLVGLEIPLGTRIFSIADTMDAMTSMRPYRESRSFDAARDEIARSAGGQFDPTVVAAFLRVTVCEWEQIACRAVAGRQ